MIGYDYDEFIRRLRAQPGCTAERIKVAQRSDGRGVEVWVIERDGRQRTMQIGPGDAPLAYSVVEAIVSGLDLPRGPFGL